MKQALCFLAFLNLFFAEFIEFVKSRNFRDVTRVLRVLMSSYFEVHKKPGRHIKNQLFSEIVIGISKGSLTKVTNFLTMFGIFSYSKRNDNFQVVIIYAYKNF